jgi:predicted nucleic acid-binding protein
VTVASDEPGQAERTGETSRPSRGLLDTSVFIALETGRPIQSERLPEESAISSITVGELQAGVLAASDAAVRARRLATLEAVGDIEVLTVDATVAASWALLRVHLAESGRRLNVNDLWIAATALAHRVPVLTQDDDFGPVNGVDGLQVIQVSPANLRASNYQAPAGGIVPARLS